MRTPNNNSILNIKVLLPLRIQPRLTLLSSYVVLHYDFDKVILSILNLMDVMLFT